MYKGLLMEATVRKNFVFTQEIANYLEELAQDSKESMTAIVQETIEDRYRTLRVKKRMKAFNRMKGSANGLLTDFSIQSVKANMDV